VADTFVFSDTRLGVRFTIDSRFRPAPRDAGETAAALGRLNMAHAYLIADERAQGWQAVLSIAAVEVEYETTREKLAEQITVHNRYVVVTAVKGGWTLISQWEQTELCGYPAMCNEYVTPRADEPGAEPPGVAGSPATAPTTPPAVLMASHVQGWTAYVGRRTLQIILGVDLAGVDAAALAEQGGDGLRTHPPEWLTRDRALAGLPLSTFVLLNA
jgi:hypothetical protein